VANSSRKTFIVGPLTAEVEPSGAACETAYLLYLSGIVAIKLGS
jgi:hypothetical protein